MVNHLAVWTALFFASASQAAFGTIAYNDPAMWMGWVLLVISVPFLIFSIVGRLQAPEQGATTERREREATEDRETTAERARLGLPLRTGGSPAFEVEALHGITGQRITRVEPGETIRIHIRARHGFRFNRHFRFHHIELRDQYNHAIGPSILLEQFHMRNNHTEIRRTIDIPENIGDATEIKIFVSVDMERT